MAVLRHKADRPLAAMGLSTMTGAKLSRGYVMRTYKNLALKLHPDKWHHPLAEDATKALNEAYREAIELV